MYIFVHKNSEICPLRDSQLRVTLTNVCMWPIRAYTVQRGFTSYLVPFRSYRRLFFFILVRKTVTLRF